MSAGGTPYLFILGCERSGSTWLANIIDAHPDTEFFMEPFADYVGIFPGFPGRNLYIENPNGSLLQLVEDGFSKLPRLKYLFYNRDKNQYFRNMDYLLIHGYRALCRITKCRLPVRIEQTILLNLNKENFKLFNTTHKNREIGLYAIKELRLNFKLELLSKVFPNAKYLVIVRHPGAQIASITNLMSKMHLGELKKQLASFPEYIYGTTNLKKYRDLINKRQWGEDIQDMLIPWWLINYDILIKDCARLNLDCKIVYHEELSERPEEMCRDIFGFIGLDYATEVNKYLSASSTTKNIPVSAVDTVRDSSFYYKDQISKVHPMLLEKISKALSFVDVSDELKRYDYSKTQNCFRR